MSKNKRKTASYIEDMLTQLRAMSDGINTKKLSYLIEMAILEARNQARPSKKLTDKMLEKIYMNSEE